MSDLYIEARLQAIKDIASASCSDIKDADNIAGFCDEIYSAIPKLDKIIEELELHSFELGTDSLPVHYVRLNEAIEIVKQEAEKYNNGWIPFVQREMTEDEKESFGDFNFMLDCQLPDEDEEILVTYKFKDELYVYVDTFMRDGSECYLDSGRDFVTEAVAWRKKPQPYQPKGE